MTSLPEGKTDLTKSDWKELKKRIKASMLAEKLGFGIKYNSK